MRFAFDQRKISESVVSSGVEDFEHIVFEHRMRAETGRPRRFRRLPRLVRQEPLPLRFDYADCSAAGAA